jgi:hypothetical protein
MTEDRRMEEQSWGRMTVNEWSVEYDSDFAFAPARVGKLSH